MPCRCARFVVGLVALSLSESLGFTAPLTTRVALSSSVTSGAEHWRTSTIRAGDEVSDWGVENLFEMMEEADEKISGLDEFMGTVKKTPSSIEFEQTMAAIEDGFDYKAVAFKCGELESSTEQNQGSAKIFSFAKLQKLKKETTLELFGRFYREDVLKNPTGDDHGNIRVRPEDPHTSVPWCLCACASVPVPVPVANASLLAPLVEVMSVA